jgi:hypothetical protein
LELAVHGAPWARVVQLVVVASFDLDELPALQSELFAVLDSGEVKLAFPDEECAVRAGMAMHLVRCAFFVAVGDDS